MEQPRCPHRQLGDATFPHPCPWCEKIMVIREVGKRDARIRELEAEVERERLRYGRAAARNAVFMQHLAELARGGMDVRSVVARADARADAVRIEDFVVAKVQGRPTDSEEG